jgi:branched-chain amino acid transport system ATP-binding protein
VGTGLGLVPTILSQSFRKTEIRESGDTVVDTVPMIETQGVGIRFGAFVAVQDVNYRVIKGETAGIIGPNGAGKSTLFNLLTGMHRPTWGTVRYQGEDITSLSAENRVARGIIRTFQLVSVFDSLSVFENMAIATVRAGSEYRSWFQLLVGSSQSKNISQNVDESLCRVGLQGKSGTMVSELSYGDKRMLEIGMALALNPTLLLLDEPFAGLSDVEITEVVELIRTLQERLTIVIIEHKISRIVDLVDRLSVMHEGHLIAEGLPNDVLCDPTVRSVYWGQRDQVCQQPERV